MCVCFGVLFSAGVGSRVLVLLVRIRKSHFATHQRFWMSVLSGLFSINCACIICLVLVQLITKNVARMNGSDLRVVTRGIRA